MGRMPRFPVFWGNFPIPDSDLSWPGIGNRETGRFAIRPGPGIGVPGAVRRGFPGLPVAVSGLLVVASGRLRF
jgi:hypothetical protein